MGSAPSPEVVASLLAQRAWLHALTRRLAGERECDDLEQDTWVAALEQPPRRPDTLRPWIAGVLRHLARGVRRTRARRDERERKAARREALLSTVELVERVDTEQRLARALLALDEPYRTTLLLRFHEGLPAAEIARRQGVPAGTVRWRCKTGVDELRERLAGELGGREALGLALAGMTGRTGAVSGTSGATTGAAAAAGAAGVIGSKGIVAGTMALAAGLAAWLALGQKADPPAPGARAAEVVLGGATGGGVPRGKRAQLAAPSSAPAQGTASERVTAGGGLTRLRVLESDGRPNAGRSVLIEPAPGETRLAAGRIDERGWVEFPASGERRRIAVERYDAFPFRTEVELAPGESELLLPVSDGELAGVVLVDGGPPARALWLLVHAASSAQLEVDTGDLRCLLGDVGYCSTDPEGRFRFRGLAPGEGYNLRAPEGYARKGTKAYSYAEDRAVLRFDGPADGVRIELERYASVHGRVLEEDGVTPASGAWIEIELASGRSGRSTGPDGTFEIFTREAPEHVRATYARKPADPHALRGSSPEGARVEFDFPEPRLDTDLGDLLLTPSAGFFLEVRDAAGTPIEGAEAGVSSERPTNATDGSGRTWLVGLEAGAELAITMRGYRTAFVTLPDPIPETLPVQLARANELVLQIRDGSGAPQAGIQLELSGPEWFAPSEQPRARAWRESPRSWGGPGSWWNSWPRHRGFEGRRGDISGGPPARIRFHADAHGRCSIGELRPGIPLHLSVLDDADTVLHEQVIEALGADEQRVVPVQVDAALHELHGQVVTALGEPVPWARASLTPAGAEDSPAREGTDGDGRFRFSRVADRPLRLTVTKDGFRPLVLEPVRPGGEELELVLVRGSDVTVRVLAATGRPLAGGAVRARRSDVAPGHHDPRHHDPWIVAQPLGDGLFALGGLADAPHEVVLELPEGVLRETWNPPANELVFWVPGEVGTGQLVWKHAPDAPPPGLHVRLEARGGGNPRALPLDAGAGGEWSVQQFAGDYELVIEFEQELAPGLTHRKEIARRPLTVVAGQDVRIEVP